MLYLWGGQAWTAATSDAKCLGRRQLFEQQARSRLRGLTQMTKRDVVLEFLRFFCSADIDALEPLLSEDLRFSGPYHRFRSSDDYIRSLRNDPPEKCSYRLIGLAEAGNEVYVFYDYEKPDESVTIAQLCRFKDGKIGEILLVFDSRGAI